MTPVGGGPPSSGTEGRGTESLWLRPGDVLIRQGDRSRDLYVLMSGELSVLGGEHEIARVTVPGEVLGELGALTGRPRTATVVARTASEVLLVRQVTTSGLERLPKVLATLDAAITRRYQIVYNKNVLYRSSTGMLRRLLLQDALRLAFPSSRSAPSRVISSPPRGEGSGGLPRHQVRQRLDDRLSLFPDADDPRVLDRIACEYGVQDAYRERLAVYPWLDDELVVRLAAVDNSWRLAETLQGAEAAVAKAECVVEGTNLLQKYEAMPGIRREMDILRMEGLVPLKAKIEALKTAFVSRHLDELNDEAARTALDRRVKIAVDDVKADAGGDVVLVVRAARLLGVEEAYEDQVRNIVGMAETGTHFVDVSNAVPHEDAVTRP